MICRDFVYTRKRLSDFGMILADPEEEDNTGLSRDILKGSTSSYRAEANHYGTVYNDVIVLNFFIVKNSCIANNEDEKRISQHELREIESWLTYPQLPQPLYVVGEDGLEIEYDGIFTDITPYVYNGLNGLKLVFTNKSPFAYKPYNIRLELTDVNIDVEKIIYCDTDEQRQKVYPILRYTPNNSGKLIIKNKTDNQIMNLIFSKKYNEVTIDCKMKRIIADSTPLSLSDVGFTVETITDYNNVNTGIFNMNWLGLIEKKNELVFNGNGVLTMEYKVPYKLGGINNV